jgi:DNA invertase Pin-like site-specific DNA recombinase
MNAAIYVRVSTIDQKPELQIAACKKYCEANSLITWKVYIDTTSGKDANRTALNELMFDMRAHRFQVVVVWKLDRLGRSLRHLLRIVEEFEKNHVDFVCTSQNFDTTTSHGKLVFRLIAAIAEFERELISERTKEGLKQAKNVGKRGKDKKPRNKAGYYRRWMLQNSKKEVRDKYYPPSIY